MTIRIILTTGEIVPTSLHTRAEVFAARADRAVVLVGGPADTARPGAPVSKIYPAVIADVEDVPA